MKLTANQKIDPQPMVQWFNPILLAKLGWQVIVSAMFGTYADHRVIRSVLDDATAATQTKRADLVKQKVMTPDSDGAVWIDYVSDLGEGFSSTYAMASLLAEPQLNIEDHSLPRGDVLIMGGDEVYPTASRDEYQIRMRDPYELAFPDSKRRGAKHPRLYAIPGNHDWYDGLDAFSGIFCRFRDKKPYHGGLGIGSWRCKQTRSYFAIKLTDDCWLWGLDIQLKGYIDQPQVDYFKLIADELPDNARILLCTAQPSWLKAEEKGDQEYRSLRYITRLIEQAKGNQKVYLMIAGDIHHYSRYSESTHGMEFITAGGGGAFLHPTHQLPNSLVGNWLESPINLRLARDKSNPQNASCYPDKATSKSLLWGNWKFIFLNWDFCIALGVIFGLLANFLKLPDANTVLGILNNESSSMFSKFGNLIFELFNSTWSVGAAAVVVIIMIIYANAKTTFSKIAIGVVHAAVHLLILISFTIFFESINTSLFDDVSNGFLPKLTLFAEMFVASFILAGSIWGLYLSTTCWLFGIHTNDGFSAMQIANYKNFLRIRISKDYITVYPIGLETVPDLDDWEKNPSPSDKASPQAYLPKYPLKPHLIETPVTIKTSTSTA